MSVKTKAKATKKFVQKHRVAIAVIVTSACWITLNKRNMNAYNDFLKDRGLYDEFWTSEDYGI